MLALLLLPSTQELATANETVKTNYQTLQQSEATPLEFAIIQQENRLVASLRSATPPKFLQNLPLFVAKIFMCQCPIRAGPNLSCHR